jgi:hypothetical protein
MSKEMMRPCIITDISESPFDACIAEVFKDSEDLEAYILLREEKNRMCLFKNYVKCYSIEELDSMYNSWVCSLADALNAPVLATEEVLDAMEKVPEAKFKVQGKYPISESLIYYSCFYEDDYIVKDTVIRKKGWYYWSFVDYPHSVEAEFAEVKIGDYIQAGDCPLALQVLLGFTTEGVPKDD